MSFFGITITPDIDGQPAELGVENMDTCVGELTHKFEHFLHNGINGKTLLIALGIYMLWKR